MTISFEDIGVASGDVFYAGNDLDVRFVVREDVPGSLGPPIDISTAGAIRWRVFPMPRGPELGRVSSIAVISKTLGSGVEVSSGPGGQFVASLVPADTQSLSGWYFHRSDIVLANGKDYTPTEGRFYITQRGAL